MDMHKGDIETRLEQTNVFPNSLARYLPSIVRPTWVFKVWVNVASWTRHDG